MRRRVRGIEMNSGQSQKRDGVIERLNADNRELKRKLAAHKKAHQLSLKASRESSELLKRAPISLLLIQKGNIVLANDAVQEQLGYAEDEILNRSFLELVSPDSKEQVSRRYHRILSGKSVPIRFEACLVGRNGQSLWCEIRAKKCDFQGRRALLFSIVGIDHWMEKEIRNSHEKKTEALLRMAAGLRQLLTECLRILDEDAVPTPDIELSDNAEFAKYQAQIESMREKASRILETLATLTRIAPTRSDSPPFDLKKIVQNAIASTLPKAKDTLDAGRPDIKIKTYLRNLAPVRGDPENIEKALVRIIDNAVEALPDGGDIYLTTEAAAGFAHVYVQDNGVGIPGEIEEKIFDPFFTTKKGNHLGLGLSLAQAAIHQHRGELEVISQAGQGTTWIIKIPLAPVLPARKTRYPRNKIRDSHILIISDEGIFKDLLSQLFLSKGGKVSPAVNGNEALKLIKKKKIDFVVIDLGLTYLEAPKIISRIRRMERGIPIAVIDPADRSKNSHIVDKLGADLFITRPLEMDRIASLVSQALFARSAAQ
jgi:PAS domain S-box-containing protein